MQSNILIKVALCVLLATVFSCATKKRLPRSGTDERRVSRAERLRVIDGITRHQLHFNTFSGRAKSRIAINKDNYDVTTNVRLVRDSAIWISVTALMGIEAGRVLITPDSVKIINRLQSEYVSQPFAYIHRFTTHKLDFSGLQQLLVGNTLNNIVDGDAEVTAFDEGYSLRGETNELQYTMQVDSNYRTLQVLLDDTSYNQRMETLYTNYREVDQQAFPFDLHMALAATDFKLTAEVVYSRVTFNEPQEMPFSIPQRYKERQ